MNSDYYLVSVSLHLCKAHRSSVLHLAVLKLLEE